MGRDAAGGENTGEIGSEVFKDTEERKPANNKNQGGSNNNDEWSPLTRTVIRRVGTEYWNKLVEQGLSGKKLDYEFWSEAGKAFEDSVLNSLEMSSNSENFNGTVPDAVAKVYNGKWWKGFVNKAHFIEVKVSTFIPVGDRVTRQISRMIEYLSNHRLQEDGITTALTLITPAGGTISNKVIQAANDANVVLLHSTVEFFRRDPRIIRVTPSRQINSVAPTWDARFNGHGKPAPFNF